MKLTYPKQKKELLSFAMLGVSVLLGILILIKVTSFFVTSARAENIVKEAVSQNKLDAKEVEKCFAAASAVADGLKKNNLFAPPPPKQHPVNEVLGIMGNEALIGDRWYKVGDKIGDARIVAIEPAQVRIEWEGKEKVFAPISAGGFAGSGGPGRGGPGGPEMREGGRRGGAPMVSIPAGGRPGFGEGGGGPGLSAEERARMREGFESMRARFENMSEEERQAFRDRMRERRGGGPGGGGPGGGGPGGGRRRGGD
jgi:hypothetical protein